MSYCNFFEIYILFLPFLIIKAKMLLPLLSFHPEATAMTHHLSCNTCKKGYCTRTVSSKINLQNVSQSYDGYTVKWQVFVIYVLCKPMASEQEGIFFFCNKLTELVA